MYSACQNKDTTESLFMQALLVVLVFHAKKIKLDDRWLDPCPEVQYHNRCPQDQISQFLQCHFAIGGGF